MESTRLYLAKKMISIVIPTKARPDKVYKQIAEVNKQLEAITPKIEIELLIVENFSSDLLDREKIADANWQIITESADLGGNHNFCNAILSASGEYVWVLGDDDELLDGSVFFMLTMVQEKKADCIIVNDLGADTDILVPRDQSSLFSFPKSLGPMIHISGYIVRRDSFLRFCHDSILFQSTFMPQLIYALNCLRVKGLFLMNHRIFKTKVAHDKVVDSLYFVSAHAASGLINLEIFIDRHSRHSWFNLVRRTRKRWLTPRGILYELAKYFGNDPILRRTFFRKSISFRHLGLTSYLLYFIFGNILLSSNYLSMKYVIFYERLRGFTVNFRATTKFHQPSIHD